MPPLKASMMAAILLGAAPSLVIFSSTWAQGPAVPSPAPNAVLNGGAQPPMQSNERQAYLVLQDQSDCTNTTVPTGDSANVKGNVWLNRDNNGNTNIKVAMTVSPRTKYNFYLKCVQQLGNIVTDDEGAGFAAFTFPTNLVGSTFAFDMYPDGAPSGNKFQSVTVQY